MVCYSESCDLAAYLLFYDYTFLLFFGYLSHQILASSSVVLGSLPGYVSIPAAALLAWIDVFLGFSPRLRSDPLSSLLLLLLLCDTESSSD